MPERSLEGLRVVEFTDEIGSYCGRLLADLGAEVIKVEPPGGGRQRNLPPFYRDEVSPDMSIAFWVHNTSKKSVVLDLDTPDGQAAARRLALTADVVLEDNPVGWMTARGLGGGELRAAKPPLVYTSVTGFGQTGPHAGYAYTDLVGQAMGAIMTLAGDITREPFEIYGNQANVSASIQAAQGTLLALLLAEETGIGQVVDVSAQESLSMSQETAMQGWDFQKKNRARTGARGALPVDLPGMGTYEAIDGHVYSFVLAPGGTGFPGLIAWMRERNALGDLGEEPYASLCANFNMAWITQIMSNPATAMEALKNIQHVSERVAAFYRTMTAVECYQEAQQRRLLVGIVSTPKTLAEDRQLRARSWFVRFGDEFAGREIEFPGAPYRLSETPATVSRPPKLGDDTAEVLAALKAREVAS